MFACLVAIVSTHLLATSPPIDVAQIGVTGESFAAELCKDLTGRPILMPSRLLSCDWLSAETNDPRVIADFVSYGLTIDTQTLRVLGGGVSGQVSQECPAYRGSQDDGLLRNRSTAIMRAAGFTSAIDVYRIEAPTSKSITVRVVEAPGGVRMSTRQFGGIIIFREANGLVRQFQFQQATCAPAAILTPFATASAAEATMRLELGVQVPGLLLTVREPAKLCQWDPKRHFGAVFFRLGDSGTAAAAAHRAVLAYEGFIQAGRDGFWCIVDARSGELVQIAKFPGAYRTSN